MPYPETPHFMFPFTLDRDTGNVVVVEQDGQADVIGCVVCVVRCPVGWREDAPGFGIAWPEYRQNVDVGLLESALRNQEPRATVSGDELRQYMQTADSVVTLEVEGG